MPTVRLEPQTPESEQALPVVWDAIVEIGPEWKVEGPEPERMASAETAVWVVNVVIAWEVVQRALTQRLVEALEQKVRDLWTRHGMRMEIVLVTEEGEHVHRVKPPRRWLRRR